MIDDEENELFETTKTKVADTISTLVNAEHNPVVIYAAMMSVIFDVITTEGFWDDETLRFEDIRGLGNLMWKLREKAFADLVVASSATAISLTV